MVIDTTRLLFRFIISALSATACIFPNRETVGEPVEPLPAGLPDCCLRACRIVACGLAGPLPAGLPNRCLRALPDHGHFDGLSDRSRFW